MNTKQIIIRTALTFAALTIAGITVAASARIISDALAQTVMVAIGSAMFGAGLTFFLVRIFALIEK